MLRELSELILDIESGLESFARGATEQGVPIRLTKVELTLPLDLQTVFRSGGCVLLADVPRDRSDSGFVPMRSSLALSLAAAAVDECLELEP